MNESQQPVTKEMWYMAQKSMADTIKNISDKNVSDIKSIVDGMEKIVQKLDINTAQTIYNGEQDKEMAKDITEIKTDVKIANGRTRSLETSRTQMWTAVAIIVFLGGAIITLSVMAIDTKINDGIDQAFNNRFDQIEVIEK